MAGRKRSVQLNVRKFTLKLNTPLKTAMQQKPVPNLRARHLALSCCRHLLPLGIQLRGKMLHSAATLATATPSWVGGDFPDKRFGCKVVLVSQAYLASAGVGMPTLHNVTKLRLISRRLSVLTKKPARHKQWLHCSFPVHFCSASPSEYVSLFSCPSSLITIVLPLSLRLPAGMPTSLSARLHAASLELKVTSASRCVSRCSSFAAHVLSPYPGRLSS